MPTLAEIRSAIAAKLAGIQDVGVVHAYERYAANMSELKALYLAPVGDNVQLRGWNIRRVATKRLRDGDLRQVTHTWEITGYGALQDVTASELAFDGLIETIRAAFDGDEPLAPLYVVTDTEEAAGLQVADSAPVLFAGVLCHAARLVLQTRLFE